MQRLRSGGIRPRRTTQDLVEGMELTLLLRSELREGVLQLRPDHLLALPILPMTIPSCCCGAVPRQR